MKILVSICQEALPEKLVDALNVYVVKLVESQRSDGCLERTIEVLLPNGDWGSWEGRSDFCKFSVVDTRVTLQEVLQCRKNMKPVPQAAPIPAS